MATFVKRAAGAIKRGQPSTSSLAYKARVAAYQKKKAAASKTPVKTGVVGKPQILKK